MKNNTHNQRKASFWSLFIFMGIIGLLIGLLGLDLQPKSPDPYIRDLSPITIILIGYIPCQLGVILFWLASRRTGHKDGIPIK